MNPNDSNKETSKVEVAEGKVLYNVVRSAFQKAGLIFYPNANTSVSNNTNNNQSTNSNNNNNYHFEIKNDRAVLVWFDTIRDLDYFTILKPWQVVNRLPQANVICRKAPFVRIIQRIQPFFPQLYQFLPKSYILPLQKDQFIQAVAKHDRKHIIKPDNGSLGAGIIILEKKMSYSPASYLAIAQEYVESYLIDQTKFDLRIYCLVSSINPLKVFVYRGGVARFCSQPVDSTDSVFSQLTNTAVNKTNPNIQKIESITQMVNDVFEKLKKKNNVDIEAVWKKIDKAITLTILAAYNYLLQGEEEVCKPCGYSRCFQIFGFDVLLDQKLDPTIMEVNYRPSLETDTKDENSMKCEMLSSAMKIAAPLNEVQEFIRAKFINDKPNQSNYDQHNGAYSVSDSEWIQKVKDDFLDKIQTRLNNTLNETQGKFVQTYPCTYDNELSKQYSDIIEKVKTFPTSYENRFKLPIEMRNYTSYRDNTISLNTNVSTTKSNNNIIIKKDTSASHLPPIGQKLNQTQPLKQIQQNKTQQQNQQNKLQQQLQQSQQNKIQQSKPQQQLQQNKTQQTQQTQQIKTQQTQQNKTQQPQQNKTQQTQQQPQQNKPIQPQKQIQQTNQSNKQPQKSQQTQQNSKVSSTSSNGKPLFEVREPTSSSSTIKKRNSNSKREQVNSSFPSHSEKLPYVSRPSSNKATHVSSTQSMSKTISLNASAKTTTQSKDSISNAKSTGTINSLATTNSNNKDKVRASATNIRTNRPSSNKKPNIMKKADTLRFAKPQYSKV